ADSGAQATFTTTALAVGGHDITAIYNGDAAFAGSTSASLRESVIRDGTAATVSTSSAPAAAGQAVTFTATLTSDSGTPAGTVTFLDGSAVLGTASLSASGAGAQASFATSGLTQDAHSITAVYGGDSTFNPATSDSLVQTVEQLGTLTSLSSSTDEATLG